MKKFVCDVCGYEYDPEVGDPENGIEPGTAFEDLPRIGFAHYVLSAKTNSAKRKNQKVCQNMEVISS